MASEAEQISPAPARTTGPAPAGLHLREVEPADGQAVHTLLTANIPGVLEDRGRWLRRWQWQYWDNPFRADRPAGWVLTDGDHIVGHLGAVYVPFRLVSQRTVAMIGADYAVGPDALARGGVFAGLQLAKTFFDAATDCIPLATTANDKTAAVFTRFGCTTIPWTQEFWRVPVNLAQQIRACRGATSRIARKLLTLPGSATLTQSASQLYRVTRRQPGIPPPPDCRLETTSPQLARDLGRIDEHLDAIGIDRGNDYLDWRYARHPERANIRVLVLRRDDASAIAGAFVFLEDRGPQRIAFIEDIVAPAERTDIHRTLFCAALRLAADNRADTLVTTTGRLDLRGIYWELGFESRTRSAPAVVIRLNNDSDEPVPLVSTLEFWHGGMF